MTQEMIELAMQRLEEMYIHAEQHEGQIIVSVWTKDLSDSFDMVLSDEQVRDLAEDVMYDESLGARLANAQQRQHNY